jgi:signal transduction histidine kinase
MRRRLTPTVALLVVSCLVAGVDAVLAFTAGRQPAWFYVTEIGAALVWATVGALAVAIRPDRLVGRLMQVLGLVLLLDAPAGFELATQQAWVAVDLVVARAVLPFQIVLFSHLLLAYPDGRLRRTGQRRFITTAYFYAAVVGAVDAVAIAGVVTEPGWTGAIPEAGLAGGGSSTLLGLGWLTLAGAYLVLLLDKIRRATRRERRMLAYPLGCGVLMVLGFLLTVVLTIRGDVSPTNPLSAALPYLAVVTMPGAFLLGLVRDGISYGSVAEFVRTIEGAPVGQLQAAMRKALNDSTLEIAFPRDGQYVGEQGVPVRPPTDGSRAVTPIGGDPPIAVVLHDASLSDEPKLLTAASAATRLALDNARLHALVQQQLAEVRASRRRIVDAGVDLRRRLERDLHDGAQQRMLAVGIALQLAEQRLGSEHAAAEMMGEARRELQAAIDELRELARGIHPPILTEQGLSAAVRALARRVSLPVTIDDALPHRLPPRVESAAYFVVSEALNNVVKHAQANKATVRLALIADRVRVEVVDDGVGGANFGHVGGADHGHVGGADHGHVGGADHGHVGGADLYRGGGLRGLADRAAAFDGSLSITEAQPTGTRLVVELRCE